MTDWERAPFLLGAESGVARSTPYTSVILPAPGAHTLESGSSWAKSSAMCRQKKSPRRERRGPHELTREPAAKESRCPGPTRISFTASLALIRGTPASAAVRSISTGTRLYASAIPQSSWRTPSASDSGWLPGGQAGGSLPRRTQSPIPTARGRARPVPGRGTSRGR
jgi:hypothetical protein